MNDTNQDQDKKKNSWKANLLDFFHNYFIGISHLECTEEECPLVYNWNDLERKLSKKGEAVLYKITDNNWITLDLINYETNDLGTYENIEIKFKSGKTQRTEPKNSEASAKLNIQESGYTPKLKKSQIFLKADEFILFFNNSEHSANLNDIDDYLDEMWEIKQDIIWDRDKSKKKVFLHVENEPNPETEASKIDAANKDYLFYIADPSITNEIKKMEIYSPSKGTEERQQLHVDYEKTFSEIRRIFGIRHLTSKKEERQNNPEIELNEAQFIALERDKKRERLKSIQDFEKRGFCSGTHTLTYGTAPEQREEKVQEIKEIKEKPKEKESPEMKETNE